MTNPLRELQRLFAGLDPETRRSAAAEALLAALGPETPLAVVVRLGDRMVVWSLPAFPESQGAAAGFENWSTIGEA